MITICHPRERSEWLTLRSGTDQDDVLTMVFKLALIDHRVWRYVEETEFIGYPHVLDHRSTYEDDLTSMCRCNVYHLLDSVDMGCERSDDHSLRRTADDTVQDRHDLALGCRETWDVSIGRVCEEDVDTLLAKAREGLKVCGPAIERQLIHLEVTGVKD